VNACAKLLGLLLLAGCSTVRPGDVAPYRDGAIVVGLTMPARAPTMSQQFLPETGDGQHFHLGLDIVAARGAPVIAAAPGVVMRSFFEPMRGHQLVLDHGINTKGQRVLTAYRHLTGRDVQVGQTVARGARLGGMGNTGALGVWTHLHFEVLVGPELAEVSEIDPNLTWKDGPGRVTCFDAGRVYEARPLRMTYPVACLPDA
jgi:murein DD-endopeptidase MepM/ murein hydrolase activator NlpD